MTQFAALRPMAEQFMTDRCTISSPPTVDFDEDTGHDADTAGAEVYAGKCQVRPVGADVVVNLGEGTLSVDSMIVRLPAETVGVTLNDVVTVTSSDDPYLVGRELRVRAVLGGTDAASRNLYCENVQTAEVQS